MNREHAKTLKFCLKRLDTMLSIVSMNDKFHIVITGPHGIDYRGLDFM